MSPFLKDCLEHTHDLALLYGGFYGSSQQMGSHRDPVRHRGAGCRKWLPL